ncbi:MAG TPA: hypothetical protein VIF64_03675, partial [Pyrinomonadaceae bacterium]
RFTDSLLFSRLGSWGSAVLHPRAGSPAGQPGWGARLYATTCSAGSLTAFTEIARTQGVLKNLAKKQEFDGWLHRDQVSYPMIFL